MLKTVNLFTPFKADAKGWYLYQTVTQSVGIWQPGNETQQSTIFLRLQPLPLIHSNEKKHILWSFIHLKRRKYDDLSNKVRAMCGT